MATEPPPIYFDSYTLERTKEIVRPGDFVMMNDRSRLKRHLIAKVDKIMFVDHRPDDPMFIVHMYSRPEEILSRPLPFIGKDEVIVTNTPETLSQTHILRKCFVHPITDYILLRNAGKLEDYHFYYRYGHKIKEKSSVPKKFSLVCVCRKPYNPDRFMVRCNKCRHIFHPICLGMTNEQAREKDPLFCLNCSFDGLTNNEFPESSVTNPPQVEESEKVSHEG